jgi:uncharacterized protein YecT (DUF1311 family)
MKWVSVIVAMAFISAASAGDVGTTMRKMAPRGMSDTFFTCADRAGYDDSALGSCISVEKKSQDERLNRAYAVLMKKLSGKAKDDLRDAERAWLTYVGKSYDAELGIHGQDKTVNIDVATHELYRYCQRANELEDLVFFSGE